MRSLFNVDNPFWQAVNKILQCMQASVLWLLFCVPVITIGASTAALYATVYRFIRKGRGYVWQTFRDAFKENLKKCTVIWILAVFLLFILGADLWIFRRLALNGNTFGSLYWVILAVICIVVTWLTYVFCYAARFEGTVKEIFRTSFILFILHPLKAVMVFLFLVGGAMLILSWPVFILLAPAAVLWISSLVLEDIFHRYMRKEDLEKEKEEASEL